MKTEKIILYFIATSFGLLVAGGIFYFLQTYKKVKPDQNTKTISIAIPSPTPIPSSFLNLEKPKDEEVVDTKNIKVFGKTAGDAVIIVVTNDTEEIITPAPNGDFTTNVALLVGQNIIEVTSIFSNGETKTVKRTVTFSTEDF